MSVENWIEVVLLVKQKNQKETFFILSDTSQPFRGLTLGASTIKLFTAVIIAVS